MIAISYRTHKSGAFLSGTASLPFPPQLLNLPIVHELLVCLKLLHQTIASQLSWHRTSQAIFELEVCVSTYYYKNCYNYHGIRVKLHVNY